MLCCHLLRGEDVKKVITVLSVVIILLSISIVSVYAEDYNEMFDLSGVYNSLSDEAKQSLNNIGAESADAKSLSEISLSSIITEILNIASNNISGPLKGLISITALLLLSSILSAYKNTLSGDVSTAINITSTLCITCAVVTPTVSVIDNVSSVIESSSNLLMAYLPIMIMIMASSGNIISSGSYYSLVLVMGESVAQISSKIVIPFLNIFLGLGVTSGITPDINLNGFLTIINKTIKWILGFIMAVFTTVLTFKQLITTSLDNVSSKALKFTINSFIPIVGSALSDAYKTLQGSIGVLKSGVGVFVILSIAIVFLPLIIQTLMWIFTLWIGKATAEALSINQTAKLLENISTVFSTLLAIVLCIMSIYIISTAIVLIIGGGSG